MTVKDYLEELDSHLVSLPDEEREMAVNFYKEYFEDAGVEGEESVMDELGKPFQLAKSIIGEQSAYSKSEIYLKYRESNPINKSNQSENGVFASIKKESAPYAPQTFSDPNVAVYQNQNANEEVDSTPDIMPSGNINSVTSEKISQTFENNSNSFNSNNYSDTNSNTNSYNQNNDYNYTNTAYESPYSDRKHNRKKMSGGMLALWILFIIFIGVPVILPLVASLFMVLVMAFAAIGMGALAGGLAVIAGIIAVVIGIGRIFTSAIDGVAAIAAGCVAIGVGILIIIPCLLFCCKTVPWCFKGLVKLTKKMFGRRDSNV